MHRQHEAGYAKVITMIVIECLYDDEANDESSIMMNDDAMNE